MLKILVIRNDKLGDFMLAWQALSLLKKQYPDSIVTILIPSYTKPLAEICPWIDAIIIDDLHNSTITDAIYLAKKFKKYDFDISISLYSEMRTALALWLARIPTRIGPATKLAQLFLNRKLKQKRSLSLKPEYEYNTDLVRYYISYNSDTCKELATTPYLVFNHVDIKKIKTKFINENNIDHESTLIFIHPGSGGSAINLSLQQYADLAKGIRQSRKAHFVLTAGPDELAIVKKLAQKMQGVEHSIYHSTEGLVSFSKFINICDLFISGSTGPLHIAGALNIFTVAFYPARKSATPLRWQTLNSSEKRLSFSPEVFNNETDMSTINIETCIHEISFFIKRL